MRVGNSKVRLTERHLQAVWFDASLRPPRLYARDGRALEVIDPGRWNLGAGPDFRDAVIELGSERKRIRGDVEIHLRPGDWEVHGHGRDPLYANVAVHVTWSCGPEPRSLPRGAVSVWLGRHLSGRPDFALEAIDLGAYPYAIVPGSVRACASRFASDSAAAVRLLATVGRVRLRQKARRLVTRLGEGNASPSARRQVFYAETMEALGYSRNRAGFRRVAEAVPLEVLLCEPENSAGAFLAAGGFVDWRRGETRPENSPENRLVDAAALFVRTRVMDLADQADFSPGACRRAIRLMREGAYIGKGRAAAVFANVVVPFALAEGRLAEIPDWLPCEDISAPVRLMAFRLFGRDHNPHADYARNGLLVQGLLELYRSHCEKAHPFCEACSVPPVADSSGLGSG